MANELPPKEPYYELHLVNPDGSRSINRIALNDLTKQPINIIQDGNIIASKSDGVFQINYNTVEDGNKPVSSHIKIKDIDTFRLIKTILTLQLSRYHS